MKVLIDFTQIPLQKVGVGVYAENLVKELIKIDKNILYYIIIQDDDHVFDGLIHENIVLIKVSACFFRFFLLRFFLEQIYLPLLVLCHKIMVIHSLHYSFPILTFGAKRVVTIHDMTFFLYPKLHKPIKRCYFRFFIMLSTRLADKIILDSYSTLHDLNNYYNVPAEKTQVIHLGKPGLSDITMSYLDIKKHIRRFGLNIGDYILFIGTLEPRKNISRLIKAYNLLYKDGIRLPIVIIGKKGWYYDSIFKVVNNLKLESKVIFTGFIPEEQKPYFIAGAKMFVYPSIYEGFGMPVLESMSYGIPTITSNRSSLPEVAGNAALMVDPENIESIYTAMKRIIMDKRLCLDLRKKSLKRSKEFSWARTAEKTKSAYLIA